MRPPRSRLALTPLLVVLSCAGCARSGSHDVEVRVRRVALDPSTHSPVVLLEDPAGEAALPIWIGAAEARSIAGQLTGDAPPRPLMHDLVRTMLERIGARLRRVVIRDLRDGTYLADVVLERDGKEVAVDSRPSDAIVLALGCGQPIFVDRQLFAREAVAQPRRRSAIDVTWVAGVTVQDLTPALADYFAVPTGQGAVVADSGPDAALGLRRGDVILELDGEPVRDARDFRARMARVQGAATLRVQRDGGRVDVPVARGHATAE